MLVNPLQAFRDLLGIEPADLSANITDTHAKVDSRTLLGKLAHAPKLNNEAKELLEIQRFLTPAGTEQSLSQPEVTSAADNGVGSLLVKVSNAGEEKTFAYHSRPGSRRIGTQKGAIDLSAVSGLNVDQFHSAVQTALTA